LTTRIKFCGLRRPEDVATAVELEADYLGFVFAPSSPRALEPQAAEALLAEIPTGPAQRVGVFQDQPLRFINEVVRRCRLDLVQLHGHEPRDLPGAIVVPVLRAMRVPTASVPVPPPTRGVELAPNVFGVLIDAMASDGRSGGTGRIPDAGALEAAYAGLPAGTRVFLAGGLRPDTVAARIRNLAPFAVDVSSGIESAPGVKDRRRMAAFVAAVRSDS